MSERFSNEILVVLTATEWDVVPASTVLRIALFGGMYEDTANPSGPRIHYDARVKSDIIFTKQIGLKFWADESGIDFGYVDCAIEDQDDEYIDFAKNVTVCQVDLYQVDLGVAVTDQLKLLATATCADIGFANENTIRFRLTSILAEGFDNPINELYYGEEYPQLAGKPYPIAWGLIQDPMQLWPTTLVDGTSLLYHVTDVPIESFEGEVYDRGVALYETTNFTAEQYGFTLLQNPSGRLTCGRILTLDPEDTGAYLLGLYAFIRLAMTRATVWQYANQAELETLEYDVGMGEQYPMYSTNKVTRLEEFLDQILGGVTGWYYVDELTEIHFGRLTDPDVAASSFDFTDSNMVGRIKVNDDKAPGLSTQATYGFSPGAYTEDEIAGGVQGLWRTNVTNGYYVVEETVFTIPTLWTADDASWTADDIYHTADGFGGSYTYTVPSYYWRAGTSDPVELTIGFCDDYDCSSFELAQAEIDRWWTTLYQKRRRFYTFDVTLNDPMFNVVLPQLGEFCSVQSDRFRLIDTPKNLFIRKLKMNFSKNLLTLEGWG